jgi:hypothetical protein
MLKSFSLPHENTKRLKLKHTFFHTEPLYKILKKAKLKTANWKKAGFFVCRYVIQRHNVTVFYAKVI